MLNCHHFMCQTASPVLNIEKINQLLINRIIFFQLSRQTKRLTEEHIKWYNFPSLVCRNHGPGNLPVPCFAELIACLSPDPATTTSWSPSHDIARETSVFKGPVDNDFSLDTDEGDDANTSLFTLFFLLKSMVCLLLVTIINNQRKGGFLHLGSSTYQVAAGISQAISKDVFTRSNR